MKKDVISALSAMLLLCSSAYAYTAGTYTAQEKGYAGYVTVTMTIDEEGKIASVKADGPNETPTVGGYALEDVPGMIVKAQSTEVDAYSGATFTRDAIVKAAQNCLEQASKPAESAAPAYKPGTYTAQEKGYAGYVTVTLTIDKEGKIASVKAEGPSETPYIGGYALEDVPGMIVKAQSTEVDAYAGATFTRNAVVKAAQSCLEQAAQ